jgi:hypothetical protein
VQRRGTLSSEHDRHDRVLLARFAAGDAYPSEQTEAQKLVDGCAECAALATDIRLIAARTADLPQVTRPRDFRISPEQADKLRGSWFDRVMRNFASPGWGVARPLAGAAMAIGLALVVVGALPLGNLRGGPAQDAAAPPFSLQSASNPAIQPVAGGLSGAPSASDNKLNVAATAASSSADAPSKGGATGTPYTDATVENGSQSPGYVTSPTVPSAAESAPPPEATRSEAPLVTSPAQAYVATTGPQRSQPPADTTVLGTANAGTISSSFVDGTTLVVGGMLLAFAALTALGLMWFARRRYSDPLVR